MEPLLGWLMLASWIAIVWMMWKILQDGSAAVRAHLPLRAKETSHRDRG